MDKVELIGYKHFIRFGYAALFFLIICAHGKVHASESRSEGSFTKTNKGEWMILSPQLKIVSERPKISTVASGEYYQYLTELGEKANLVWNDCISKEEKTEKISEILDEVNQKFLQNVIDEILINDELLEKIAKASYRNVTGFLKVVLVEDNPDGWKIRLHSWNQDSPKEFPHNHKWDFYSKIISGYLSQDVYHQTEEGSGVQHAVREPISLMPLLPSGELPCPCRDHYELALKGADNVSLTTDTTDRIGVGESYFFPNHLIHTIVPSKGAISFVFASPRIKDSSNVFIPIERLDEDLTKFAPSISKEEMREELLQVKDILGRLYLKERYLPEIAHPNHAYFSPSDPIYSSNTWRKEIAENCARSIRVKQRSEIDLEKYIVQSKEGTLIIGGRNIDPSKKYLFVLMDEGMYATEKDFQHDGNSTICHSSFTQYGPAISAGIFHFAEDRSLQKIEAYSGHYQPDEANMELAKNYLDSIGIDTSDAEICCYSDK